MGSRGPTPKRSSERAGHRAKDDRPDQVTVAALVRVPPASRAWAPSARRWYQALRRSGQTRYFEPSDWEYARLLADLLTRELSAVAVDRRGNVVPLAPRATMTRAILAAMGELGTTEGARRRMSLEVERVAPDDGAGDEIASLEAYRRRTASD